MKVLPLLRALPLAGALALSTPLVASAQTGGGTQQTKQATFGNLIAALNNISAEIKDLSLLNNLTVGDIRVVNVSDLLNGNNVNALNNSLNRNHLEIVKLTDVLNNNTVLTNFLNNANIAVSRVIAIDVLSGGGVTLFVQPQVSP